jgi:hypothetical protein
LTQNRANQSLRSPSTTRRVCGDSGCRRCEFGIKGRDSFFLQRKSNGSKRTLNSFWVFILFRFEIDFIPISKKEKCV